MKGWYHWTLEEQWAVAYAQNAMLVSFVWYLGKWLLNMTIITKSTNI